MTNLQKPVAYLDIDDTLIVWNRKLYPHLHGNAAPMAKEFILWLNKHFEVRWLTMWCPSGVMYDNLLTDLSKILGLPEELLRMFDNPKSFVCKMSGFQKTTGINFEEVKAGRPFVWIEDRILDNERTVLFGHGCSEWHVPCNVSINPDVIQTAWDTIRNRFAITD